MVERNELNNVNQRIRDNRKCNETNLFDFTDIPKDEDIDLKQFLDVAENHVVLYQNEPNFNILVDAGKDKFPFILQGIIKTNGEQSSLTNRF